MLKSAWDEINILKRPSRHLSKHQVDIDSHVMNHTNSELFLSIAIFKGFPIILLVITVAACYILL